MTSSPITSWPIEREKVEAVTDFLLLDSKITVDGDYSHVIREWLLLGKKAMANLDSALKSKGITLPTKVCLVKVMVFPVVMYGCQSCTIKKAEHQRIDAFELWCWRRLLRVLWTASRSNQSILEEITTEYSLEGMMLKLNSNTLVTWCKQLTHWKRLWCFSRGWDGWMASPYEMDMNLGKLWETVGPQGREESDTTGQLNNNSIPRGW